MLTNPLQESCIFAELGNVCSIIMSKHLVSKDGICNLFEQAYIRLVINCKSSSQWLLTIVIFSQQQAMGGGSDDEDDEDDEDEDEEEDEDEDNSSKTKKKTEL